MIRILFAALLFVAGCGESNPGNTGEPLGNTLLGSVLEQHGLPRDSISELPPCGTWKQYLFGDPGTYHHIETLCREGELISAAGSTVFCGTQNSIESATPAAPYADMCAYMHDPISALPPTCDPAEVNEMPDERIEAFAKSVDGGSYGVTTRWDVPPVVRIASNVPERQRILIVEAVARINAMLPGRFQITVGSDVTPGQAHVPQGEIYFDFAEILDWKWFNGDSVYAPLAGAISLVDIPYGGEITRAHIWISPSTHNRRHSCEYVTDSYTMWLTTHELLHAVAFPGHIGQDSRASSIMTEEFWCRDRSKTIPGRYDCAALRRIYELESGTPLENID